MKRRERKLSPARSVKSRRVLMRLSAICNLVVGPAAGGALKNTLDSDARGFRSEPVWRGRRGQAALFDARRQILLIGRGGYASGEQVSAALAVVGDMARELAGSGV